MLVVRVKQSQIICTSVINPGEPNVPAGVRGFGGWDMMDIGLSNQAARVKEVLNGWDDTWSE